jgi:hypothetical protein
MSCKIFNTTNNEFNELNGYIEDMYGFFSNKYNFSKHPSIHLKSDDENKAEILGKTAYYDPQALEVHIYVDGRHPKDILRSIAHELIHHLQNLEGRLQVDGYHGPGYYLKNDKLKQLEHEAMKHGNGDMREWEDNKKYNKEVKQMSLKEWKNNELNQLLLKRFGIIKEEKMPQDVLDNFKEKEEIDEACGDELEEAVSGRPASENPAHQDGRERDEDRKVFREGEEDDDDAVLEMKEEEIKNLKESIKKLQRFTKKLISSKRGK